MTDTTTKPAGWWWTGPTVEVIEITPHTLPSADELIEALGNEAMPIEECRHIIIAHFNSVLEAAAEVADTEAHRLCGLAEAIRKLKEEL